MQRISLILFHMLLELINCIPNLQAAWKDYSIYFLSGTYKRWKETDICSLVQSKMDKCFVLQKKCANLTNADNHRMLRELNGICEEQLSLWTI